MKAAPPTAQTQEPAHEAPDKLACRVDAMRSKLRVEDSDDHKSDSMLPSTCANDRTSPETRLASAAPPNSDEAFIDGAWADDFSLAKLRRDLDCLVACLRGSSVPGDRLTAQVAKLLLNVTNAGLAYEELVRRVSTSTAHIARETIDILPWKAEPDWRLDVTSRLHTQSFEEFERMLMIYFEAHHGDHR